MSAKLRVTLWFALMVLILSAMMLVFVLVMNGSAMSDDPVEQLVRVVMKNAKDVEFDRGRFEWDDLHAYKRGVYSSFYRDDGELEFSACPPELRVDLPFERNLVRSVEIDGQEYYVFDEYVDMEIVGLWVRGIISAADQSGLMHTIIILTCVLLPIILVLALGGGWLVAVAAFKPMENIVSAANSISDGGDLTQRVALRRGPTEMRRLSDAFDRMFERLERSFNTERQFASDASHELRTPITVILAECSRAKRKGETKEDFLASINVIEEQGKDMSELVQNLLGLTRMQQGTDRYPMREDGLSEFVEACAGEFISADRRGISLEKNIEPNVRAKYNPSLMSRVIQNLLQNAYKYGKEGGHIRLSLRQDGDKAVIEVEDDGIGIAPEDQDKIWQRFWQADVARDSEGSSGLGLAMVKEISEFHGGTATVESTLGRGSKFTVTI